MRTAMLLLLLALPSWFEVFAMDTGTAEPVTGRWYTEAEQERGATLYATYCSSCHGSRAEGQPEWEQRNESGYYPAPPLDGTGHSAHHPLSQMLETLDTGGGAMGGWMPSFVDVLSNDDKRAVIAWIQSLWPSDTYVSWLAVNKNTGED